MDIMSTNIVGFEKKTFFYIITGRHSMDKKSLRFGYKNIGGGARRAFAVTIGLREGYGPTAVTHTLKEVVQTVLEHLKARASGGQSYLTGTVTSGEVVYAWPEGEGKAGGGHEPVAVYSGEVSPLYNTSTTDEEAKQILTDLASTVGSAMGQTRVYVAYRDEMFVLQEEETATPTGETVS